MFLPSNYNLKTEWSFYHSFRGKISNPEAKNNYALNLNHITDFSDLKEFLSYYLYLKPLNKLPIDNKIIFFKKGKRPCWEDYNNGGCWIIQIKKKEDYKKYNDKFKILLFSCISEEFGPDCVGILLSIRQKKNLIEIWVENNDSNLKKTIIGEKIKEILDKFGSNNILYYKDHKKSLEEGSTLKGIEHYEAGNTPILTPLSTPIFNFDNIAEENNMEELEI